ncbi:MAG: NUDIX domain-containing protein [Anaerolineae bacterium]|nr:NUDIX domain-containing protein [Anaerolineae bacterium]
MNYVGELRRLVGTRPLILVGAETLVFDPQNRLLLLKRTDNGTWVIPGGMMEPGETLEETARRETQEETGLLASQLFFFKMYSGPDFYYRYPHGDEVFIVSAAFICVAYTGDLTTGDETQEIAFFPLHELPQPILHLTQVVIDDYLQLNQERFIERPK